MRFDLELAKLLNDNHITWAFGASYLLREHGLQGSINDYDILVDMVDAERAVSIFNEIATVEYVEPDELYQSKIFRKIIYKGKDIDLISGLTITNDGKKLFYDFKKEDIDKTITVDGIDIYLMSLIDWYYIYDMIPYRKHKSEMIYNYLKTTNTVDVGNLSELKSSNIKCS